MKNIVSVQGTLIDLNKIFLITPLEDTIFEVWFTIQFYGPGINKLKVSASINQLLEFTPDMGYKEIEPLREVLAKKMKTLRNKITREWNQNKGDWIENFDI